jgi:hypothetical protein
MFHSWKTTRLETVDQVLDVLLKLKGKNWICRGQAERHDNLFPSIDRNELRDLPRIKKLELERKAINLYKVTARHFTSNRESVAQQDDNIALMVLRQHGVPSRLLDWSMSPHKAAYFAVDSHEDQDGEIWAFDEPLYETKGKEQWLQWPQTTTDGSGDDDKFAIHMIAFSVEEPPDWFVCQFYSGFPRQDAQDGAFTLTAKFNNDHAEAIERFFKDGSRHHLYTIDAKIKQDLRERLRNDHGIWRGSLFPDSAGAAKTARSVFD